MTLETSPSVPLTPELLSAIAGILLSLLASYLPGFSAWFDRLTGIHKRLVMLGLLLLSAAGIVGLSCAGVGQAFGLPAACDQNAAILVIQAFLLALVTNQSTYVITPDNTPAKSQAKAKTLPRRTTR
ncbi:MAG: hypothetical protein A2W35_08940 [Chloroflexi bacterium RBG_16_57_11]|nr:MAG: hypothetical protein A2W35_08940 [Chloroflexi bacterium RBG_16_57_11]